MHILKVCLKVLDVVLEGVGEEAELLNVSNMLFLQWLRPNVDREVSTILVHLFVKYAALAVNLNCQVDDEVA